MSIRLDHLTVPVRDRRAASAQLAAILGVPFDRCDDGPFTPVYVSDSLTLDFDETAGEIPVLHYCFHVSEAEFDGIVGRLVAQGIPYRGRPHGPDDRRLGAHHGGRIVYWNVPEGHVWEALTKSYARAAAVGSD